MLGNGFTARCISVLMYELIDVYDDQECMFWIVTGGGFEYS